MHALDGKILAYLGSFYHGEQMTCLDETSW